MYVSSLMFISNQKKEFGFNLQIPTCFRDIKAWTDDENGQGSLLPTLILVTQALCTDAIASFTRWRIGLHSLLHVLQLWSNHRQDFHSLLLISYNAWLVRMTYDMLHWCYRGSHLKNSICLTKVCALLWYRNWLTGNKWCAWAITQHYVINHFAPVG